MSRPQNGVYDIGCYEYVVEGMHPLSIITTSLPNCDQGVTYDYTLQAGGGVTPYYWSIVSGNLPYGFTLDQSMGSIHGSNGATGSYTFMVRVTDSSAPQQYVDKQLTLLVTTTQHVTLQDGLDGYSGTRDTWFSIDEPTTTHGDSEIHHIQYPTQDGQLHKFRPFEHTDRRDRQLGKRLLHRPDRARELRQRRRLPACSCRGKRCRRPSSTG